MVSSVHFTQLFRVLAVLGVVAPATGRIHHHADKLPGWGGETFRPTGGIDAQQQQAEQQTADVWLPLEAGTGDRHGIEVEAISWKPRVLMLHNFLNDSEVEHLIQLAKPRLHKSMVADDRTGELLLSTIRTSDSTFLERAETPIIAAIEERIARYSHLPAVNGEPFEVLSYGLKEKNENHFDSFRDSANTRNGGNRIATMLLYLSDVEEGGETVFFVPDMTREVWDDADCTKHASLAVKPVKGAALLFYNVDPSGIVDDLSLHGGCPVVKGHKWSATKWIRAERFYMEGEQMEGQGLDMHKHQQQLLMKQELLIQQLEQLHAQQMELLVATTPELRQRREQDIRQQVAA